MPDPNPLSEVTTIGVAEGVASEINNPVAGTVWSQTGFACARVWLPVYDDADLKTLQLGVAPVTEDDQRISRKHVQRDHLVKIWLQKKVTSKPADYKAEIDALAAFAFQLKDYWIAAGRVLAAYPKVNPMHARVVPYSPKDLDEQQKWVGLVELMFRETTQQ
jgi:hypothetical protein